MSMTKSEFLRQYRKLRDDLYMAPLDSEVVALAEMTGIKWAPEPTPEPTGDLSMVRVIDAEGNTWRQGVIPYWIRFLDLTSKPWSEIPQPATVLRPEGDQL